ncbi:MAG: ArnT family glycosyltransferase [Phototrophicaceae bacterium]
MTANIRSGSTARNRLWALVAFLLLMWALLMVRLDSPWFSHHDENGAWITSGARNFETYGWSTLNYIPVLKNSPLDLERPGEDFTYYVHHPPLIVYAVTWARGLFGQTEMSTRLVPAFSTLVSLAALFVIGRRLYGERRALWLLPLYGLTPMIAYFGRMPNHEPLALPFILIFVAVFINWLRAPTWPRWALMALMGGLALWTAWAAAFFFLAFGLAGLWLGNWTQRRQMVLLGVVVGGLALSVMAFYQWQWDGALDKLRDAFFFRTSSQQMSRNSETFNAAEFVFRQMVHVLPLMTFAVVVLGTWGLVLAVRRETRLQKAVILALVGGGLLYMLVFRNAFYIHDYYKIYFMPGFTIAASVAIAAGWRSRRWRRWTRPAITALVVVSAIISVVFFVLLHRSGWVIQENRLGLAQTIQDNSQPRGLIMINLPRESSAVAHYAQRSIRWQITPQDALELAAQNTDAPSTLYVYCVDADSDPADDSLFVSPLAEMPYTGYENCRFIDLTDASF